MNRIVGYLLALVVLVGIAYAIYAFMPRTPQLPAVTTPPTSTSSETGTEIKVETIYDDAVAYRIEARYPQFGIAAVDEKIKAVVDKTVAAFKEYPANPPNSSVSQNELTISFDSVYVGPDVVSAELLISEYTGGAHGNSIIIGVNVERATGEEISLDDALVLIGKTLPQVARASLIELKTTLGENIIFPEGADPKTENYGTFLVSKERVTFIFNNYQVAPYAAGHQEVWFKRVK